MSLKQCSSCKRISKHNETCCDNPVLWSRFMTLSQEEAQIEYLEQQLSDYKQYVADLLNENNTIKQNHREGLIELAKESAEKICEIQRLKLKVRELEEYKVYLLYYIEDLRELK